MTEDLKMAMVKELMRLCYNAADKEFGYFCGIHFKIMTELPDIADF